MPIDPASVKWDAPPTGLEQVVDGARQRTLGLVRGAAGIGATLQHYLNPMEWGNDQADKERRAGIDAGLETLGGNKDSGVFKGGKLISEIAGTSGVGGLLAKPIAAAVPALRTVLPSVAPIVEKFGNAVGSSGFTTGAAAPVGVAAKVADMATRMAGGAVTGGASAGLVDPETAGTGALIGAALPPVAKAAGAAGNAIGATLRGPQQSPELAAAVQKARDVGYVIPPTQARPTLVNRALEGLAGKQSTAQNASTRNAEVTNRLAGDALGLQTGTKITPEVLDTLRAEAGQAYENVARLGPIKVGTASLPPGVAVIESRDPLIGGAVRSVDSAELVRAWKQSNHDATGYFRAYARDANPETLAKAKAAAASAKSIDDLLERQLASTGQSDLRQALRDARVRIAKTYSVESALNQASGAVDARKLAQQVQKGKMLTGELRQAADFAQQFPKANQTIEGMGSLPQTSPLDWAAAGGLSAATSNPLMMATVAARPVARASVLSQAIQNRLVQPPQTSGTLLDLFASPDVRQFGYRAAPVLLPAR